jgi:hypothetical protein
MLTTVTLSTYRMRVLYDYTQLGLKEVNHKISTDNSCKQFEKETMLYIKECIRRHQSLLM